MATRDVQSQCYWRCFAAGYWNLRYSRVDVYWTETLLCALPITERTLTRTAGRGGRVRGLKFIFLAVSWQKMAWIEYRSNFDQMWVSRLRVDEGKILAKDLLRGVSSFRS